MATRLLERLDADTLREVSRRAAGAGVRLETYVTGKGWIWISSIEREEGPPGAGRNALEWLCELADETETTMGLVVLEYATSVIELYRSIGFEEVHDDEVREDGDDYVMMVRQPE